MTEHIRYSRPKPQTYIRDKFAKGKKANKKMLVLIDPSFAGRPNRIPPHKEVPLLFKIRLEAIQEGYIIFEDVIKQLAEHDWKFILSTSNGVGPYQRIIERLSQQPCKIAKNQKICFEQGSSLLVFVPHRIRKTSLFVKESNTTTKTMIWNFIKYNKPVCSVNSYGVKRYPRFQ